MTPIASLAPETLGLLFLLGIRHGLDPDHIAVIDNITFRALDDRPKAAPWTGFLFSAGHTVSVLIIAILFGCLGQMVRLPEQFETLMSVFIIGLFLVIGTINLRALLSRKPYVPMGWRHGVMPKILHGSTHPLVTLSIGLMFGLVIDTAAQIAAWGATAATTGGVAGAVFIGMSFAAGMILTDTIDSLLVSRLVTASGDMSRARGYRRGVGWLIVGLSYIMAVVGLLGLIWEVTLSERAVFTLGAVMATTVVIVSLFALFARRRSNRQA